MATIKDVARVAGVSVATVSRVINNRGYLSDAVKEKVHAAMQQLDYHPNELARSLHNMRSNILGIIIPSVSHPFFAEVARQIEYYAHQSGFKLMLCNSLNDIAKERDYINMLRRSQVDGIIMGSHLQDVRDYTDLNLPLVSLDRQLAPHVPFVCCDNYAGGEAATRHLLEKGCKNLLHITGSLDVRMLSNERTDAFKKVCEQAGVSGQIYELPDTALLEPGMHLAEIESILRGAPECDGVFATSDVIAALVLRVAASFGRSAPKGLKVVGFDGCLLPGLLNPALTTVSQPVDVICRYAVDYLVQQIEGQTVPSQTILPVALVAGGTT